MECGSCPVTKGDEGLANVALEQRHSAKKKQNVLGLGMKDHGQYPYNKTNEMH
jgi:hypothetical protein